MSKITLSDLANLQNENTAVGAVNANNTTIEQAFDNTLSRDGTSPNQMEANLDMNSNRVYNLPAPQSDTDAVRKTDLDAAVIGEFAVPTVLGTTNEITASAVGLTTTLSLPTALTFTGKTVTGGTFTGGTITNVTLTATNAALTTPTLITPVLGTPTSGTLTNCTGLPVSTGISGLAAGIATFLATSTSANLIAAVTDETGTGSLVFATSPTLVTPALGTPASGTLTNCTGLPVSTGISGLASGVATFLATPSSANLLAAVTDETGTGGLVFATTPTITRPVIVGSDNNTAASAGNVGEVLISTGTTGSLTTATGTQAATLSLTAGDWDVCGQVQFNTAGGTNVTDWYLSISATSASIAAPVTGSVVAHERTGAIADHGQSLSCIPVQILVSSTTSYYLNIRGDFTGTAPTATYVFRARRMR